MRVSADEIIAAACRVEGITKEELLKKDQSRKYVRRRQRICWLIDHFRPDLSWYWIAKRLGYKEHSNVYHGIKQTISRVNNKDTSEEERRKINAISEELGMGVIIPEGGPVIVAREYKQITTIGQNRRMNILVAQRQLNHIHRSLSTLLSVIHRSERDREKEPQYE